MAKKEDILRMTTAIVAQGEPWVSENMKIND
jgi:hypothetical protein